jgi:hypothetical protein
VKFSETPARGNHNDLNGTPIKKVQKATQVASGPYQS